MSFADSLKPWRRLGVLVSGKGSNLATILSAIAEGQLMGEVACVLSDTPDAPALAHAQNHGVLTQIFPRKDFLSRQARDAAMAQFLREQRVDLVFLAGYMRVLEPVFLETVGAPVLNIHPSLLPSFRGLHAVEQALAAGVKIAGCTVHGVVSDVDAGPILAQAAVPVKNNDTAETLHRRIQEQEHRIVLETLWRLQQKGE